MIVVKKWQERDILWGTDSLWSPRAWHEIYSLYASCRWNRPQLFKKRKYHSKTEGECWLNANLMQEAAGRNISADVTLWCLLWITGAIGLKMHKRRLFMRLKEEDMKEHKGNQYLLTVPLKCNSALQCNCRGGILSSMFIVMQGLLHHAVQIKSERYPKLNILLNFLGHDPISQCGSRTVKDSFG